MARPLLDIVCIEEDYCDYPIAVRIAMDDGTVQTYGLENRYDYMFDKVMTSLDNIKVGYQYKPPRKRRCRLHRCQQL